MNLDPLEVALRHVCETKHLLDSLIKSSESFDYPKAKLALKALDEKSRDLAKLTAKLSASASAPPRNVVLFPTGAAVAENLL